MKEGMNYINGQWRPASHGACFEHRNPADLTEVTGVHADSTVEDVREAFSAAWRAFPIWRATPPTERAKFLRAALVAMERHMEEIALQITMENGKTLAESHAEIQSAVAEMDFQIGEGLRLYGKTIPSAMAGVFAYSIRQPLGVVSVITPWNFPWNVPVRKCTPALMAGNTVVFKPASLTPGVGRLFTKLLAEAGLPRGVMTFLTGAGSAVGNEMVQNPHVRAISFTGSTAVGRAILESASHSLLRTQLEMGGKNPAIILADANVDLAAEACAKAAFACAGQWCTSTSRVIVENSVHDGLLQRIVQLARAIRVGNGHHPTTQMGPVCGEKQRDSILSYIDIGKKEGAALVCGGGRPAEHGLDRGCFIEPTVFAEVDPGMTIAQEEIFGPVIVMIRVRSLEEAISVANGVPYGLSASVFTKDIGSALQFAEQIQAGVTHVNIMTAYKEPALCFGGFKCSGVGLPEAGQTGIQFFTDEKVVYVRGE